MSDADWVSDYAQASLQTAAAFASDAAAQRLLIDMGQVVANGFRNGAKLLVAGNGGSAADAQHIAGEFVVRLFYDRAPLPAIALTTDPSVMSATGNDYGFDHVFERQVRALGRRGDILLAISTSGNSPNILRALEVAREAGIVTMGFSGGDGGKMARLCDHLFLAPSDRTALVQQIHIIAAHIVCALVERTLFPSAEREA